MGTGVPIFMGSPFLRDTGVRVSDQSPDTLISGHLAFQNEKAPDLHFLDHSWYSPDWTST